MNGFSFLVGVSPQMEEMRYAIPCGNLAPPYNVNRMDLDSLMKIVGKPISR